ncbi:FeoB-associated Cys-rich membrane protein [Clostridium chromiireducens]|uniref:FeoB-associated Cys-rich membrane protein n=1 Tax=Clostridium chromiireducens TaxID=225345 RepID=A0A1V4I3N8_9CLOT|nr:FeoB-associated Cys-rich membrane protein [Clostridium chromiireducens]MVX65858.1 FeoB-associated Cys-rich membrane protein [Clostridium chromiireducens]OPJ54593.1 virus attachment protein p12 family protein [Clostridium chromiireducens]RII34434.1 FeoB-associated Cys-rich membrane protein [Clostridium chromiireducens]
MIEIIVTALIVCFAGFIIFKSLRNSSKGKCNCGCNGCKAEKICSDKSNSNEK